MSRMKILNSVEREVFDLPPIFNSVERKRCFDFKATKRFYPVPTFHRRDLTYVADRIAVTLEGIDLTDHPEANHVSASGGNPELLRLSRLQAARPGGARRGNHAPGPISPETEADFLPRPCWSERKLKSRVFSPGRAHLDRHQSAKPPLDQHGRGTADAGHPGLARYSAAARKRRRGGGKQCG